MIKSRLLTWCWVMDQLSAWLLCKSCWVLPFVVFNTYCTFLIFNLRTSVITSGWEPGGGRASFLWLSAASAALCDTPLSRWPVGGGDVPRNAAKKKKRKKKKKKKKKTGGRIWIWIRFGRVLRGGKSIQRICKTLKDTNSFFAGVHTSCELKIWDIFAYKKTPQNAFKSRQLHLQQQNCCRLSPLYCPSSSSRT